SGPRPAAGSYRRRSTGSTSRTGTSSRRCSGSSSPASCRSSRPRERRVRTSLKPSTGRKQLLSGSEPTLTTAAAIAPGVSRRRRMSARRVAGRSVPYLLVLPVIAVIGAILGYPIYSLVRLSVQKYDLFALIAHHGTYVGLHNFGSILHDPIFWHTLLRTVVFTGANVGLTMVLG